MFCLTLNRPETLKLLLWQTVKIQMNNAAFHWGLHCLLRQSLSSEKEMQYLFLEIIIWDPSIYSMDHPDFIVCSFMENSIPPPPPPPMPAQLAQCGRYIAPPCPLPGQLVPRGQAMVGMPPGGQAVQGTRWTGTHVLLQRLSKLVNEISHVCSKFRYNIFQRSNCVVGMLVKPQTKIKSIHVCTVATNQVFLWLCPFLWVL